MEYCRVEQGCWEGKAAKQQIMQSLRNSYSPEPDHMSRSHFANLALCVLAALLYDLQPGSWDIIIKNAVLVSPNR